MPSATAIWAIHQKPKTIPPRHLCLPIHTVCCIVQCCTTKIRINAFSKGMTKTLLFFPLILPLYIFLLCCIYSSIIPLSHGHHRELRLTPSSLCRRRCGPCHTASLTPTKINGAFRKRRSAFSVSSGTKYSRRQ